MDKNNKADKVYNTGAHLMTERKRYSAEHEIHPNQIMLWKKQDLKNMAELFKTERKDITRAKELFPDAKQGIIPSQTAGILEKSNSTPGILTTLISFCKFV